MPSSLCSLRKSIPLIAALVLLLVTCSSFLAYGYLLSLLVTSLVLILSTVFFTLFSKKSPALLEDIMQDEALISSEEQEVFKLQPESETISQETEENEEAQEENVVDDQIQEYLAIRSADLFSESESIDRPSTSEDSDVDWEYSGNAARSTDFSDGSISDEESLIEIALPSGQFVCANKEDPKLSLQQKLTNFSTDAIFGQHGLVELLAEFNEENLIEIDISMGSIKCSRFEIEA